MSKLYLKYKESEIPILFHILLCLAAYILWIILVSIILPLFMIYQIYNILGSIFARFFDTGSPLCLEDIPFMLDCESNPYVIVGFMKINGNLAAERVSDLFRERILDKIDCSPAFNKLKKYVTSSYSQFVWKNDENFDLGNYIVKYPETIEGTREEVNEIFLKMTKKQMVEKKSPWKMHIVNTIDQKSTYVFSTIHHSVGDGFSLHAIFSYLFDNKPANVPLPPNKGIMANFIHRIFNGIMTGPLAVTTVLFSRYYDNPFYVRDYMSKSNRKFSWATCPLSLVKDIKNNFPKTTVNDIFLTCLSTSLKRYFSENEMEIDELPIVISFNSRSPKDMADPYQTLKNSSGGTFVSLPMNQNLLKTLEIVVKRTKILKSSSDGHTLSFIFSKIIGLLPTYFGKIAAKSLREHCSLLVSNVAGPSNVLLIDNHEVECFISTPPLMYDLGVSMTLYTYNNTVYISILSVKKVLPDPDKLASLFVEEIEKMHKLL